MFSKLSRGSRASEIRELLKLTEKKEVISFAGGLPNPQAFPFQDIKDIFNDQLEKNGPLMLQYGTTEGVTELRRAIAERMKKKGMKIDYTNVFITSGSQQCLDLVGKVFLDPGDIVIVSAPTYLGAANAFRSYGAVFESVPMDDDGMIPELLAEKLDQLQKHGQAPKLLYVEPSFHNPAGVSIPQNRREEIMRLARKYDIVVLEDSPYSELRFSNSGEPAKSLKAMDTDGRVIYTSTFSKVLAPGFRLAWCVAEGEILNKLIIVKQATDLCTNAVGQYVAAEYITKGYMDNHVKKIISLYEGKKNLMLAAMEKYFPEGTKWTKPEGGLFIWVTLPDYMDTRSMFGRAIKNKVAYVIGSAFFADKSGKNTMRLNYSYASDQEIEEGIKRLALTIKEEMVIQKPISEKKVKFDEEGFITGV